MQTIRLTNVLTNIISCRGGHSLWEYGVCRAAFQYTLCRFALLVETGSVNRVFCMVLHDMCQLPMTHVMQQRKSTFFTFLCTKRHSVHKSLRIWEVPALSLYPTGGLIREVLLSLPRRNLAHYFKIGGGIAQ